MRLYSQRNIDRMKFILQLTRQMGVNIAGVDIILQLKDQIEQMQRQIDVLKEELSTLNRHGVVPPSKAIVAKTKRYDIVIIEEKC